MERSREIFLEILTASDKVVVAANKYAKYKGLPCVQRSHFQLEADMRRISAACDILATTLGGSSHLGKPAFDVRLQDWLCSDEPRVCLGTLHSMEKLLHKDTFSWDNIFLRGRGMTTKQDKIKEAFDLLDSCRVYFHFLFTMETLNNQRVIRRQKDVPHFREHVPEGSDIYPSPLVTVLESIDATVPDTADINKHGHTISRGKYREIDDIEQEKKKNAQKLKEILGWLDGLQCSEKQDVTLLLRQPDTCKWLFDTTRYKLWKDGENPCLWLRGKPGAGKTVLTSAVIGILEKMQREGEVLAFFYCDFRNERSTSASEVLCSILSQLLRQISAVVSRSLIDDIVEAKKRNGATRNNIKELARFVSRAAGSFIQKPFVVVDALDECKDIEALLDGLNTLKGCVRLFITARPLQVIKDGLAGIPFISMDDMAENLSVDIALHVTRELDARRRLRALGTEIKAEIHSVLCCKADGMFRWVQCSIDTLNRCVTLKEVQAALNNLPEGLGKTYERTLLAIDLDTREGQLARRALVWLVAALRPLRISELMEGLSIDAEKRTLDTNMGPMHRDALLDACGSLVTYTEETTIIVLSHFSVKEYLISEFTRAKLPQYYVDWEGAHLELAQLCMCYISICLRRSQGPDGSSNNISPELRRRAHPISRPLLDYVLKDALSHFRFFGWRIGSVLRDVRLLQEDIERHSLAWDTISSISPLAAHRVILHWPRHVHDLILYILVAFAPDPVLRAYLLRPAFSIKKGTNALVYAAYFNEHDKALTLLSCGTQLNCKGWEIHGPRQALPIEVALHYGHYSIVSTFITEGSPVPPWIFTDLLLHDDLVVPSSVTRMLLQADDFEETVNSPLHGPGLRSLDYFESFVDDIEVHEQDLIAIVRRITQIFPALTSDPRDFDPILHVAVWDFHEHESLEAVKFVVSHGYDLIDNPSGKMFLRVAIERGHTSVTQYLLSLAVFPPPDILVTLDPSAGTTAEIVRLLVKNGADVNACDQNGDLVLHNISKWFPEDEALEMAEFLVGHGCDPFKANSSGKTSLQIAIEQAHISVVLYLLSLGVPLPQDILLSLGPYAETTVEIVHLLAKHGADVHACTETGDSVLHIALECPYEDEALEIVKFLVDHGCDPLKANSLGKTSLYIAIERGRLSIAQHFISLGIPLSPDIFVTLSPYGISGMTAEMVHFLVENGADIYARTEAEDSVLHVALRCSSEDEALKIAKILVARGCDPLRANSVGKTSLYTAIERARVPVAQYLLSVGVPLPPDILVTMDLQLLCKKAQVLRFLVKNGANVHAHNEAGDPVIHVVLESFYGWHDEDSEEAVKLIVAEGCNFLETNSRGKTPLDVAIERKLHRVERYLRSLCPRDPDGEGYDVPFGWDVGFSDSDQE